MSIYHCGRCGSWFDTTAQLKFHKCGVTPVAPVKPKVKEPVPAKVETDPAPEVIKLETPVVAAAEEVETKEEETQETVVTETPAEEPVEEVVTADETVTEDLDRDAMVVLLKEAGQDGRSLRNKTDAEIKELFDQL